jgi:hypothetical protein
VRARERPDGLFSYVIYGDFLGVSRRRIIRCARCRLNAARCTHHGKGLP